jgi:hypothetical protein
MTHAPTFATPQEELAELAAECVAIERHVAGVGPSQVRARNTTRDMLVDHARDLGIALDQIDEAVEAAIKAASGATR